MSDGARPRPRREGDGRWPAGRTLGPGRDAGGVRIVVGGPQVGGVGAKFVARRERHDGKPRTLRPLRLRQPSSPQPCGPTVAQAGRGQGRRSGPAGRGVVRRESAKGRDRTDPSPRRRSGDAGRADQGDRRRDEGGDLPDDGAVGGGRPDRHLCQLVSARVARRVRPPRGDRPRPTSGGPRRGRLDRRRGDVGRDRDG